jgi:DNA mismatch repair ATPase MutS
MMIYSDRIDKFTFLLQAVNKKLVWLSFIRFLSFISMLLLPFWVYQYQHVLAFVAFVGMACVFFFLIKLYLRLSEKKAFLSALVEINEHEIEALQGNYVHFPNGKRFVDTAHEFSHDLDIFGDGSLFQHINRTAGRQGKNQLADWLQHPCQDEKEIYARQEAVKELSDKIDWRQDLQATGQLHLETNTAKGELLAWLLEKELFNNKLFYRVIRYLLPAVTLISIVLAILGAISSSIVIVLVLVQFFVIGSKVKQINRINIQIGKKYELLNKYSRLLVYVENENFTSSYLTHIQEELTFKNSKASMHIKELSSIIRSFDTRNNLLMNLILNGLFMWDIQCVFRLEKWRATFKDEIPRWLDALGKTDALASLACFAFNHKGFGYPEIAREGQVLEACGLGHPLINDGERVDNDLDIGHLGEFIIITGANMAGKSTFLRTIGTNMVLAMSGAPVCATSFRFRVIKLFTSMRTSDSLLKNESYFYAELKRLKQLIDVLSKGEEMFIILDEILKGTNSLDKQTGSMALVEKLVALNGSGVIATHDLALGDLEIKLPGSIHNLCFEIEIDGSRILFDYKLRKGVTQKMNANLLMKQMGIIG